MSGKDEDRDRKRAEAEKRIKDAYDALKKAQAAKDERDRKKGGKK